MSGKELGSDQSNSTPPLEHSRICPLCEGKGCEECDDTGRRYRKTWVTADGVPISVSGSGEFNPALGEMFEALAKAAGVEMERRDDE